jgi:signal peptidase I
MKLMDIKKILNIDKLKNIERLKNIKIKRRENKENTEKNLKKLNRTELLEIIWEQEKEIEILESQVTGSDAETVGILDNSEIEAEWKKEWYQHRYRKTLKSTIGILITVAAIAILVATLWLPVLRIYGNSMTPTLNRGDLVVSVKSNNIKTGDIIAFYYNNKILIKRVIATSGDWVDITEDGTVYVNDVKLDEPYVKEKALGDCNITLPYQVPDSKIFVMGDHRSTSYDSRNTAIGCVSEEQIVGHLVMKIWPLKSFKFLN